MFLKKKKAKFKKGELVYVRTINYPLFQILKVRWNLLGEPIYKIRYYNSLALFTGVWVTEDRLYRKD